MMVSIIFPMTILVLIVLGFILIINTIKPENKIVLIIAIILGIIILPYMIVVLGSIIMILPIPLLDGVCSDPSGPNAATDFAYKNMITKENVTFINIAPNNFEDYCFRHYWVTDTEGTTYRLVWSKMHNEIKLNQSYTIRYTDGYFNALWEFE